MRWTVFDNSGWTVEAQLNNPEVVDSLRWIFPPEKAVEEAKMLAELEICIELMKKYKDDENVAFYIELFGRRGKSNHERDKSD